MTRIRSFVAVPVSLKPVLKLAKSVKAIRGVKGIAPENLHLTLKFLGDVDTENEVPDIIDRLEGVAKRHSPFSIHFIGTGAFPDMSRARVAWIGIESPELIALGEDVLSTLPYRIEEDAGRGFSPHLTIGRLKHPAAKKELRRILQEHEDKDFGTMEVMVFYLMKSVLTPSGPIYSEVAEFQLRH